MRNDVFTYEVFSTEASINDCKRVVHKLLGKEFFLDQRPLIKILTVSPRQTPGILGSGTLVYSAIESSRAGNLSQPNKIPSTLSAQIAVKMATDCIVEECTSFCYDSSPSSDFTQTPDFSTHLIRSALTKANHQLYQYGEKMHASERISATGCTAAIANEKLCIARVGSYQSYLLREGKLTTFYESTPDSTTKDLEIPERQIGASPQIRLELAGLYLQANDQLIFTSLSSNSELEAITAKILAGVEEPQDLLTTLLSKYLRWSIDAKDETAVLNNNVALTMILVKDLERF